MVVTAVSLNALRTGKEIHHACDGQNPEVELAYKAPLLQRRVWHTVDNDVERVLLAVHRNSVSLFVDMLFVEGHLDNTFG